MDTPGVLYKYCSPERISVITDGVIRYSQLGAFNDPFEGRPSLSALAPEEQSRRTFQEMLPREMDRLYASLPPDFRAKLPYDQYVELFGEYAKEKEPKVLAMMNDFLPTVRTRLPQMMDELVGVSPILYSYVGNECETGTRAPRAATRSVPSCPKRTLAAFPPVSPLAERKSKLQELVQR